MKARMGLLLFYNKSFSQRKCLLLNLNIYLQEHIIHVWEETGADFHNCLIQLYCEKVQGLMKEYLNSFPAGMLNLFWWEGQGLGTA